MQLIALITVVAVGFSIAGITSIPSNWKKWKRKRLVASIPALVDERKAKKRKSVERIFIDFGLPGLIKVQRLLASDQKLKSALKKYRGFYGGGLPYDAPPTMREEFHKNVVYEPRPAAIGPLLAAKLVTLDETEGVKIDPDIKGILESFISQVSERN